MNAAPHLDHRRRPAAAPAATTPPALGDRCVFSETGALGQIVASSFIDPATGALDLESLPWLLVHPMRGDDFWTTELFLDRVELH